MNRIEYIDGQLINGVKFLHESKPRIMPNGYNERRGVFLCSCGNKFNASINGLKRGNPLSCGCLRIKRLRESTGYSYLRQTKYYNLWTNIKNRCYNKKSNDYKFYGMRGIKLSDEFKNDSLSFIKYVMSLPDADKDRYSLDSIDNNGNYERGNLRWTSKSVQAINRRKQYNNTSGFVGVYKNVGEKCSGRWISSITHNGYKRHLGMFDDQLSAAICRDKYIIKNKLQHKLNVL